MSELTMVSCDACGKTAPEGHNSTFPHVDGGPWMNLRKRGGYVDFCSVDCLAEWAVLRASDKSAVKPRQTAARKPRGRTSTT